MIDRTFTGLKFKRTYVGGSKKHELEIFMKVQGNKEDNSECDWIEYRRILTDYFNDILHITISWELLTKYVSYFLAFLSLFLITTSLPVAIVICIMSIMLRISSSLYNFKAKKRLSDYDYSLNVILLEIKKQTGLELSKN